MLWFLRTIAAFGLALLCAASGTLAQELTPAAPAASDSSQSYAARSVLRERYYDTAARVPEGQGIVGRLGLVLIDAAGSRVVTPNQKFRSGDRFRFAISTNQNGWLHVFYLSGNQPQQVWPRKQSAEQAYPLCANKEYLVPPVPAVFRVGDNPGKEIFFFSIGQNPSPPLFDGTRLRQDQSRAGGPGNLDICAEAGKRRIINFDVRDPLLGRDGGISFDPGTEELDPYTYFAAPAGHSGNEAMTELRLHHVR